ncbi:hypothetical protein DFQ28_001621 [Apophysomyces sp. BC1034]|nr:hypothetical protein DFQ30_002519 [Apophysomyces sp. BC1015]KAG0183480.1 hypothetical protein DFQ28_001621 [Apophysomyces sp. BC1034]
MKKKATLLFEDRMTYPDGAILEMRIWRLPERDAERPHGLKYSLFYGRESARIIGYDNERGKGDHRHYRDREEPYIFSTAEQMVADFLDDVERERGGARDMGRRFVSAFERAATGEDIEENHITFLSLEEMMAALTPKRLELLRYLHRESANSVSALARVLSRDYKRVHADVSALEAAGLVVREDGRLTAPWDALAAEVAL